MRQYFLALATFAGTTIGVGLFGLPYAASQIGFMPMLIYFGILGFIMLLINLALAEVTLRTAGQHRLPGYAEIYLGKRAKIITLISNTVGLYVGMVAYIVIGGGFLASLMIPILGGNIFIYTMVFYFAAIFIIFLGSKTIARSEFMSLVVFFGVLIYLFFISLMHIRTDNLFTVDLSLSNIILPYGVILFALTGASIIPEVKEILFKKERLMVNVIAIGTFIPAVTYIIFMFTVVGVTGLATTPDALKGLQLVLGSKALVLGFIFGIITTFTSYISIGLTLKKIYWYDFKMSHLTAWMVACLIPIGLYFAGFNNFITIAAFSGAVTMGVDSIIIFLTFLKARKKGERKPEFKLGLPNFIVYILIAIFLIGAIIGLKLQ